MNTFSDFKISTDSKSFTGDKINIGRVLNRAITVHEFKIEDSKHYKNKCLHMQISVNNEKRVLFTGAQWLIEAIQQVPENGFPFTTTIIKQDERYMFT